MNTTFNEAIDRLFDAIKDDYCRFKYPRITDEATDLKERMIGEFNESLSVNTGRKYAKIIQENSVWGFVVVTENDKKFRYGDILKAAGYNAPVRNAARGNIFDEEYSVNWTGPHYL